MHISNCPCAFQQLRRRTINRTWHVIQQILFVNTSYTLMINLVVHSHGSCLLDKGPNFCLQFIDKRHRDLGSGMKHHCVIFIVEKEFVKLQML